MYAKSLFSIAFALFTVQSASAEDVSYQAQSIFAPGDKAPAVTVRMPDPARGLPKAMEIEMMVSLEGVIGVENTGKPKAHTVLFSNYGGDVSGLDGNLHLGTGGQFVRAQALSGFDGALDFAGNSGNRYRITESSESLSQVFKGKELAVILGTKAETMSLNISGGAASSVLGPDSSAFTHKLILRVQVNVTYIYDDAPAPSPAAPNDIPSGSLNSSDIFGKNETALDPSTDLAVCAGGQKQVA